MKILSGRNRRSRAGKRTGRDFQPARRAENIGRQSRPEMICGRADNYAASAVVTVEAVATRRFVKSVIAALAASMVV